MKVDIWSDVRCPFCYIGKEKFEKALGQFPHKDKIEVVWRSFELDPHLQTDPGVSTLDHLAQVKGVTPEHAGQMTAYAAEAAGEVGLELDFSKAVVANSFKAHQLIQLAKTKGLAAEIETALFKAHFSEGKNIDDTKVLLQTAVSVGLEEKEVEEALSSDTYAGAVRQDEAQAQAYGIRGVPYFVFNDKYAVSGAQAPETFLGALTKSFDEFEKESGLVVLKEGVSCSADGSCQ